MQLTQKLIPTVVIEITQTTSIQNILIFITRYFPTKSAFFSYVFPLFQHYVALNKFYYAKNTMNNFRQIFYQIVFITKFRRPAINKIYDSELYKYIRGIISNKQCTPFIVNGTEDHIHIFCDLHPSVSLSDLIRDIKVSSNIWMKENGNFPAFEGWQPGYGAFTYSVREKEMIYNYIKQQKEYHEIENFHDEFKQLLVENQIPFEEKYLL